MMKFVNPISPSTSKAPMVLPLPSPHLRAKCYEAGYFGISNPEFSLIWDVLTPQIELLQMDLREKEQAGTIYTNDADL